MVQKPAQPLYLPPLPSVPDSYGDPPYTGYTTLNEILANNPALGNHGYDYIASLLNHIQSFSALATLAYTVIRTFGTIVMADITLSASILILFRALRLVASLSFTKLTALTKYQLFGVLEPLAL
jgi:hypothetical protein